MNKKLILKVLFLLVFSSLNFISNNILASSGHNYFKLDLNEPNTLIIDRKKLLDSGITELRIPSNFENTPIYKIKSNNEISLPRSLNVNSIIIEEGIKTIGLKCFHSRDWKGFNNVSKVVLPKSLKIIEDEAFLYMTSLTNINLQDTLTTSIGKLSFYNNQTLKQLKLPDTLESIGESAFYGTSLTKIFIPKSVSNFGHEPFGYFDISQVNRDFREIFIDSDGKSMPNFPNETFRKLEKDVNLKIYFNGTIPEDKNDLKPYLGNSIDITTNVTTRAAIGGHQFFMKDKSGKWVNLYNLFSATEDELPTLEPPIIPSLSANGQTIINIGISKDENAPDRLSVTVPTNLAILIHAPNNENNPVDVYIGGGNNGKNQAKSSLLFLNGSHSHSLSPTAVEIKSATISNLEQNWKLEDFDNNLSANQIALKLNNEHKLTVGTQILNISLNDAFITQGQISQTQTSIPIKVKVGGNCSDYQAGKTTSPAFNINWRIGKKNTP